MYYQAQKGYLMKSPCFSRRSFLKATGLAGTMAFTGCATTSQATKRLDGVYPSYIDEVTGVRVYNLTPDSGKDLTVYQTHPMWTPGMEHLVFTVDGAVSALNFASGKIYPLPGVTGNFALEWDSSNLYCLSDRAIHQADIPSAIQHGKSPEKIATLPAEYLHPHNALSVGPKGSAIYTGVVLEEEKKWGIAGFHPSGWRTLTQVEFNIGHIQAHPTRKGSVLFCWETGGDSPQRTWIVDERDGIARPAHKETYNEWVTHEVWWGEDRIIFTIWPYDDEHKKLPHGVAWIQLGVDKLNVLAQYPAWHTHGSPDGKWALGDDFARNIWLINMKTQERRLLTQGHLGKDCKTHPHASFTPDSRAILLNSSHFGAEDLFLVPLPEWDSLAPMQH